MVTGKNKEQFKKYLYDYYVLEYGKAEDLLGYAEMIDWVKMFDVLPFEMQIGVYLAYYDSLGMKVYTMGSISENNKWSWSIWKNGDFEELIEEYNFTTRNEAYKAAFKKADELLNQNKDE